MSKSKNDLKKRIDEWITGLGEEIEIHHADFQVRVNSKIKTIRTVPDDTPRILS